MPNKARESLALRLSSNYLQLLEGTMLTQLTKAEIEVVSGGVFNNAQLNGGNGGANGNNNGGAGGAGGATGGGGGGGGGTGNRTGNGGFNNWTF